MRCNECKFYEVLSSECHRYPPTHYGGWPTVDHNHWCGEFKPGTQKQESK